MKLNALDTEQINKESLHIDEMDTLDILKVINNEDQKVAIAVKDVLPKIAEAVDCIYEKMSCGGRLIYIGAGTSGRLGILDASECPPTYGVEPTLVQGLIAGGKEALTTAIEGAEDSQELAILDLKSIELNSVPPRMRDRLAKYQYECAKIMIRALNSPNLDGIEAIMTSMDYTLFRDAAVQQHWNAEAMRKLGVCIGG